MEEAAATRGDQSTNNHTTRTGSTGHGEIFKALEIIERDSLAIAGSFTSLFASLRFVLSEATRTSVDHISVCSSAITLRNHSDLDLETKPRR
ncbi:Tyrosine--tRNA ligase [Salix suchowensis]|nr:Tyrosine--tRNA ligase [Salix suchowensis]